MDKDREQHPNLDEQTKQSTSSAPIDEMTDKAREQKARRLAGETEAGEKDAPSGADEKPQHS